MWKRFLVLSIVNRTVNLFPMLTRLFLSDPSLPKSPFPNILNLCAPMPPSWSVTIPFQVLFALFLTSQFILFFFFQAEYSMRSPTLQPDQWVSTVLWTKRCSESSVNAVYTCILVSCVCVCVCVLCVLCVCEWERRGETEWERGVMYWKMSVGEQFWKDVSQWQMCQDILNAYLYSSFGHIALSHVSLCQMRT